MPGRAPTCPHSSVTSRWAPPCICTCTLGATQSHPPPIANSNNGDDNGDDYVTVVPLCSHHPHQSAPLGHPAHNLDCDPHNQLWHPHCQPLCGAHTWALSCTHV